ncbi:MAG: hypothetical protein KDE27_18615 [Planctomycetes bacterium]|nr:hypothetical protein [Planctomycetota bacterium]
MTAAAMSPLWFRRLLTVCPVLVGVLWVAGVARFREIDIAPVEWAALVAVAFALHLVLRRARRPRPLPPLPEGANPVALSGFAAAIVGVLIGLLGALAEWLVEHYTPSHVPLGLRALWHGACAFAAAYCGFLLRLQDAAARQQRPNDRSGEGGGGGDTGSTGDGAPPPPA